MREDGASSDEEADMLMALAQQAGPTPKSQTPRSSQRVSCPPAQALLRVAMVYCIACHTLVHTPAYVLLLHCNVGHKTMTAKYGVL